ncbi:MAG: 4-(cytidine 5'-diphospho)-2-C-methyl-D-erythritol kinase [Muribaculaceae bacterium]|nr:4-(cytidine 5'-diphospho)-2-C-methyl-D-erythritol kinase [Muribaculaceae bacterium]
MIKFVNAKINIGLQIVRRREDGYHDLQTLFYPVGVYAGTPENPVEFCDILEITAHSRTSDDEPFMLRLSGNIIECPVEKNLVWKAAALFFNEFAPAGFGVSISLDKHLPDGAGLGGGSADASFTLTMLCDVAEEWAGSQGVSWRRPDEKRLLEAAARLGADCPFFILNRAAYAEGIGERLRPVDIDLSGYWLVVVKPHIGVSTREAFAGVRPAEAGIDLREICHLPPAEWRDKVINDFEKSIFPAFPDFPVIKDKIYETGALYASLTGSGACLYGIYSSEEAAAAAVSYLQLLPTISAISLLKL